MNSVFKNKLRENKQVCIGSWLSIGGPAIAEIMCQAGFEWIAVDLEHSCLTLKEAEELIRVIDLCGRTPLVRLSCNDPVQIKRVMDCGAHGIIVPMVNSRDDAERAFAALHYPPQGTRGVGLARAQGYGTQFQEYRRWVSEGAIFIPQIEHINAVRNLEEILSFEGVDGLIIGPYDLSSSLGIPGQFDHPSMKECLDKIKEVSRKYNKTSGFHIVEPDHLQLSQRIQEGYRLLAYSVDFRMLDKACRDGLSSIRSLL